MRKGKSSYYLKKEHRVRWEADILILLVISGLSFLALGIGLLLLTQLKWDLVLHDVGLVEEAGTGSGSTPPEPVVPGLTRPAPTSTSIIAISPAATSVPIIMPLP